MFIYIGQTNFMHLLQLYHGLIKKMLCYQLRRRVGTTLRKLSCRSEEGLVLYWFPFAADLKGKYSCRVLF